MIWRVTRRSSFIVVGIALACIVIVVQGYSIYLYSWASRQINQYDKDVTRLEAIIELIEEEIHYKLGPQEMNDVRLEQENSELLAVMRLREMDRNERFGFFKMYIPATLICIYLAYASMKLFQRR